MSVWCGQCPRSIAICYVHVRMSVTCLYRSASYHQQQYADHTQLQYLAIEPSVDETFKSVLVLM